MTHVQKRLGRLLVAALATSALLIGATTSAHAGDPKIPYEKYTLPNGLEVILHQDRRIPLVTVDVWYHVGSGDEILGKSGFAHLFEHMLFQGSKNVGEDKHFSVLKNIGSSSVNGSTNTDRTNYFETVPSHQLETALWLESDRMGYLLPLLTRKSLDNQIEVVRNERRQRIDNVPYGKTQMRLYEVMFPKPHPYHYSVIGDHRDLASSTLADVRNFYKKWYVPANATVVIAGDFEKANCKKLIKKWFGSFPKSTAPKHKKVAQPKVKAQRIVMKDKFARLTQVKYAWPTPAYFKPGDAEMQIIAQALTSRTGRLYKRLVLKEQLATRVRAYQDSMEMGSIFVLTATLRPRADLAKVEAIINEEIAKVRTSQLTAAEMKRSVVRRESSFVWRLESLLVRAELLHRYNHYVGDPGYVTKDLDRYRKATASATQNYAATHLTDDKRITIVTKPAKKMRRGKRGMRRMRGGERMKGGK